MPTFKEVVQSVGLVIDGAGVLAILAGIVLATLRFVAVGHREADAYRRFRQDLGRGILLGLEFLVAADIIRTVAVTPTLESVLVLGLIVLIRTFLSMALQVEVEGRWPWQRVDGTQPRPLPGTNPLHNHSLFGETRKCNDYKCLAIQRPFRWVKAERTDYGILRPDG